MPRWIAMAWFRPRSNRARHRAQGTQLSRPSLPNELWCADYKGEFMLADRRYCYPLTITDFANRYLLGSSAHRCQRPLGNLSQRSGLSVDYICKCGQRLTAASGFSSHNTLTIFHSPLNFATCR